MIQFSHFFFEDKKVISITIQQITYTITWIFRLPKSKFITAIKNDVSEK